MKTKFISLLLMAAPIAASAQLVVNSNGTTLVGTKYTSSSDHVNFEAGSTASSGTNIGVAGTAKMTGTGISCGIYGSATNSTTGMNFGVLGTLYSSDTKGAGVFGSTSGGLSFIMPGKYGGFFFGDTYVTGTLTANNVVQTSDIRLKENIMPLSNGSTLKNILNMNVVKYNYKKKISSISFTDGISTEKALHAAGINPEQKHIGLIAQELKELYPDLVIEGQDGYLAINYIELVPVLVQAIQELNQKIEELESATNTDVSLSRSTATAIATAETASGNVLYQNTPNPFKEQTTIRFALADDVQSAAVCIFDMSGRLVKKLPVSQGDSSVTLGAYELGEGMFLYTLLVNGREIDTKRMIITK